MVMFWFVADTPPVLTGRITTVNGVSGPRRRWDRQAWPVQLAPHLRDRGAAGISIFELSRVMGTSVGMIDRTYGHLAIDSEDVIRARLDARAERDGVEVASGAEGE